MPLRNLRAASRGSASIAGAGRHPATLVDESEAVLGADEPVTELLRLLLR